MKRLREPVDASLLVNDDDIDFVDGVYVVRKKQNSSKKERKERKEKGGRDKEAYGGGVHVGFGSSSSSSSSKHHHYDNAETAATSSSSLSRGAALYTPRVNMKNAAVCVWTDEPHANLVEIVKMRGNFWRSNGFSHDSRNYLYAEELLLLAEKGSVVVVNSNLDETGGTVGGAIADSAPDSAIGDASDAAKENSAVSVNAVKSKEGVYACLEPAGCVTLSELFARALPALPMPVYLTYSKLKSLEYIVMRHNRVVAPPRTARSSGAPLRAYGCAQEVRQVARGLAEGEKLIDAITSFDIFICTQNWSKKNAASASPVGFVVVTTSAMTFPANLMLRLLDEAAGIPILMAAVMSSGYVMLEEFTDAITALDWSNEFADDNDTSKLFTAAEVAVDSSMVNADNADEHEEPDEDEGPDINDADIDDDI